jgi:catechol 2,3-dioxygenase-like lactoylglutathione lyase family enzyme
MSLPRCGSPPRAAWSSFDQLVSRDRGTDALREERGMSGTTRITGVGTVGVPVTDQDRALEFYLDKLGFEKRRDLPFGDGRWIEVAPPGSATTIALVPAGIPAGIRLTTRDATTDHADLQARGVEVDPEVMRIPEAPPMFTLRDPDGNSLILVEGA